MKRLFLLASALLISLLAWSQATVSMNALPEDLYGDSLSLALNLCNDKPIKAFQCDLTLPEAITFNEVSPIISDKIEGFEVDYKYLSDKQIRVLISSGTASLIAPDSATLLRFSVKAHASQDNEAQQLHLTNITMVFDNYQHLSVSAIDGPAFAIKPSFVVRYYDDSVLVHTDTIKQDYPIVAPELNLKKEGYTFMGWSDIPTIMPADNVNIYALYNINTYRLVYMVDDEFHAIDSVVFAEKIETLAEPTKEGYTFSGWQDVPATMPAKDDTISGKFTVNKYLVTYVLEGEVYKQDSVAYGSIVLAFEVPAKEGYNFDGWNGLPETMPAKDIILQGAYSVNRDLKYNVVYLVDDIEYKREKVVFQDSIKLIAEPIKEGHSFSGWRVPPVLMPLHDVTIKGFFTANKYKLTYVVDGEVSKIDSVIYGVPIVLPEEPTKEGYTFSGWQDVPATMPAKDDTIKGVFNINTYRLVYMVDGLLFRIDSVIYGTDLIQPEVPVKEGYTFSGWNDLPATMPAKDVQCEAFYVLDEKQHDSQGLLFALNAARDAFEVIAYADTLQASLVIPTELYGLPVTTIAPGALAGAGHLRSIEIPSSIQTVGEGAFSECYNLLTIEWNSPAALRAACFDEPEAYGNMLVFCKTAETAEPAVQAAADELFAGNVVIDGVAENIRLTDGRPFSNPRNFTAKNITYSREFTKQTHLGRSGGWEALVLPFAVQTVTNTQTGATLVPFAVADFTYTMPIWQAIWQAETQTFVQSQAIEANQPFLMQVPNSTEYQDQFNQAGEILFSAKNTELKAVETTTEDANSTATGVRAFSLKGAYEGMAAASDRYVINDEVFQTPDGELIPPGGAFVSDLRALRPFEAYIQLNPASNVASQTRAGYLRIGTDTSTGIESLKMTGSPASHGSPAHHWYNLQGLRLPSRPTQPGLYIHNGEKVMIK